MENFKKSVFSILVIVALLLITFLFVVDDIFPPIPDERIICYGQKLPVKLVDNIKKSLIQLENENIKINNTPINTKFMVMAAVDKINNRVSMSLESKQDGRLSGHTTPTVSVKVELTEDGRWISDIHMVFGYLMGKSTRLLHNEKNERRNEI